MHLADWVRENGAGKTAPELAEMLYPRLGEIDREDVLVMLEGEIFFHLDMLMREPERRG